MIDKYPRTFHLKASPCLQNDDKWHGDDNFFLDKEVVITEKMDGGCTGIHDGNVYARSTGQIARHGSFDVVKAIHAPKTYGDERVFYGENLYGVHSIEYGELPDVFFLFGVLTDGVWSSWDDLTAIAAEMSFKTVPCLFRGTFTSMKDLEAWMEGEIKKPSTYGGHREGFVIRTAGSFTDFSQNVAKYVRAGHVQTDEHWSKNWSPARFKFHE